MFFRWLLCSGKNLIKMFEFMFMQSVIFKSTERKEPNELLDKEKRMSQEEKLGQEIPENSHDDSEISRIEQLMKGKTFSRYQYYFCLCFLLST